MRETHNTLVNRLVTLLTCICITLVLSEGIAPMTANAAESDAGYTMPYRVLTADEIVNEMGAGWNLGNTMDGHTGFTPLETLWQSVVTTQKLITSVHDMGFNTVRIPVTWGTMIDDANGYAIREEWIGRVQDIVDYCISLDMYVIINVHHDGAEQSGWLRIASEDFEAVKTKFTAVWRNIATYFCQYDEHLIFEAMNEVTGPDSSQAAVINDTQRIMELNQCFVDVVRTTGGNNAERWLSVCGRYTNIENTTSAQVGFSLPHDTTTNRLFVSVHDYSWAFGMQESLNATKWSQADNESLQKRFSKLYDCFTSKGIPVVLGEYGCVNKYNSADRALYVEGVMHICKQYGIVGCYWDQGWYDRTLATPDYSFTLIDRITGETIDKEVTDALMRGYFLTDETSVLSDIEKSPFITTYTDVTVPDRLQLTCGEHVKIQYSTSPAESNDVMLWSSADSDVATVYNGTVFAHQIGVTTITCRSQSGSVEAMIPVYVKASKQTSETESYEILTRQEVYTIEQGDSVYLDPYTEPEAVVHEYYFTSADESICTVSSIGKLSAIRSGVCYITISTADGTVKSVYVSVTPKADANELQLALNVYFNDNEHLYYNNEVSTEPITVTGDGQYTLHFDCATDLSDAAQNAGVTGLRNLTAVYIKDYAVTMGDATSTPLTSCNIRYDAVIVDGTELTITKTEPKKAMKSSGVFDTNDPLNSWDGSAVEEVTVNEHVLNITTATEHETHQRIEVTFTLSDMQFAAGDVEIGTEVSAIMPAEEKSIALDGAYSWKSYGVNVGKAKKGASITFLSSDTAVVYVNTDKVIANEDGIAYVEVYAMGDGVASVTAISENEKTLLIPVICSNTDIIQEPTQTPTSIPEPTSTPEPTATPIPTASPELTEIPAEQDVSSLNMVMFVIIVIIAAILSVGFGMWFGKKRK